MADVVLKRHCKLLSFFTIITINHQSSSYKHAMAPLNTIYKKVKECHATRWA